MQLNRTRTLKRLICSSSDIVDNICLAHTNQPGFDCLQPMGNTAVFYESKYSEPQPEGKKTSTKLKPADVNDKTDSLKKEIELSNVKVGGQTISSSNSVFVLVAHRDKVNDFADIWEETGATQEFPIIVFDRDQLVRRYGETFGILCSFMLTYCDRNYTQPDL